MNVTVRTSQVCCFLISLVIGTGVANACMMADRLREVAPHLTEEEIKELDHGSMVMEQIPYNFTGSFDCIDGMADIFACDNVDLVGFLTLAQIGGGAGADIWGWTDPETGNEYALLGRSNGLAIIDVSNPGTPVYVGNLPSQTGTSTWRDVKVFNNYAFVVADWNGAHGMQVLDLTQLRTVVSPPVTFSNSAHYDGFGRAHNIVINEATGFGYAVGSDTCSGGLHMIDISDPLKPAGVGCFSSDGYTHDAECVVYNGPDVEHQGKEICFNSNEDTLTIVDVTNKAAPVQLSRTGYEGSGYVHQGSLTANHRYYVHDDELDERDFGHNTRTYMWDLLDLDAPIITGHWDAAAPAYDHNQYIKGNHTYQANYRRGLRILALTDPDSADFREEAFFDTFPSADANGFGGAWSVYPYFESGLLIVSDMSRGLFILRANIDGMIIKSSFETALNAYMSENNNEF